MFLLSAIYVLQIEQKQFVSKLDAISILKTAVYHEIKNGQRERNQFTDKA